MKRLRIWALALAAVCCLTTFAGCQKTDVLLKAETAGLDGLLTVLLKSVNMREPTADAAKLPGEDIWHFVIGTAGLQSGEYIDQPYNPDHFPWEERSLERSADGGEFQQYYHFLPMENVRQIAYEFFGVSDYSFRDPGCPDESWDGFAVPDGIGLNDFNAPLSMVRKAGEGDQFTVELELGPGGMGEAEAGPYDRYLFHFRLITEDGRSFVRFVRSERAEDGQGRIKRA